MKTTESICIDYTVAVGFVKELSAGISKGTCERTAEYLRNQEAGKYQPDGCPVECLGELFADPELGEDGDQICEVCQERLRLIKERKLARQKLGSAKRAVFARGKMLMTHGRVVAV